MTLESFERSGRVDVIEFWSRRVARLFPALSVVVAVCALSRFLRVEDDDQFWHEKSDLLWALAYLTNVNAVFFRKDDYFEATLKPSITRHLWTLSIEEQYYIAWPLLFLLWTQGTTFFFRRVQKTDTLTVKLVEAESASIVSDSGDSKGTVKYSAFTGGLPVQFLRALAASECLVIVLSYVSSAWTIQELGMSAAYYSTWSRAGDFACGGLVYILVRLNPSLYRRYSQQPGLPRMSTRYRVYMEVGVSFALLLTILPPMVQVPLKDLLPWYFYAWRIPFSFFFLVASVHGGLQISEPLPRWAVASRFLTCKSMTLLGVASYGIYVFHWPLIVLLGETSAHESVEAAQTAGVWRLDSGTAGGASDAVLWRQRQLANLHIFALSVGIGIASFLLYEKPLIVLSRRVRRPWKVLAAGLAGTLLTAAFVCACFSGVPNPYTTNGRGPADDLLGRTGSAVRPADRGRRAPAAHRARGSRGVLTGAARRNWSASVPPGLLPGRLTGGGDEAGDGRFTPLWLFGVHTPDEADMSLATLLDANTEPQARPPCLEKYHDCLHNVSGVYSLLSETQPANTVVIMCESLMSLSPCGTGKWKEGVKWVWLRSPVLCRDGAGPGARPAGVLQRCPDELRIEAMEMPGVRHDREIENAPDLAPGNRRVRSATGSPMLDTVYLIRTLLNVDLVAPGAINMASRARLRRLLGQHEAVYAQERFALVRDSIPRLRLLVLGESIAARLGLLFFEVARSSEDCQQELGRTMAFPGLAVTNLANRGSQAVMHFLECTREPPAPRRGDGFSKFLPPVCGSPGETDESTARNSTRESIPATHPDIVVVHDQYWGSPQFDDLFGEARLFEGMSRFLALAMENGVKMVFWLTRSTVKEEAIYVNRELSALGRYVNATRCSRDRPGIEFVVLHWHRLTCPTYSADRPSEQCPEGAHGFYKILPDYLHPSGPPGAWLAAQCLSAVMAHAALSLPEMDGYSSWDAAVRNPVSSCLLWEHPPDGDPPLSELVDAYWVCPPRS